MYTTKPFIHSADDFAHLAYLDKLIFGDHAGSTETWREDYAELEHCLNETFFIERNGQVVMSVQYHETPTTQEEGKVRLWAMCDPSDKEPALYEVAYASLEAELRAHQVTWALGPVREDMEGWLAELRKHNFKKVQYQIESELDLTTFDNKRYQPIFNKLHEDGISIRSLQDLMENDTDWLLKLYEMQELARIDIPRLPGIVATKLPLDEWQKYHLRKSVRPEYWFIAVTFTGEYIGMGNCQIEDDMTSVAGIGFVGVLREHRRKGVATALKVASMSALKEAGFATLRTNNDEKNPMLQLNFDMGFVRQPSWITMEKRYHYA